MREGPGAGWAFRFGSGRFGSGRFGSGTARFTPNGDLTGVATEGRPDLDFLTAPAVPSAMVSVVGGRSTPLALRSAEVVGDLDEIEVVQIDSGRLRLTLRQAFAVGWRTRWAFTNDSGVALRISDLLLPMTPGPGCLGWGLAAGAEARYSLHPRDGAGPLLAGRLRRGSILSISTHGLAAADFDLAPGGRYVLDWDWSWFETPLAYTAAQPPVLPASTVVIAGTPIILAAGPDVAVLAPEAVDIQTGNDRYEFSVSAPARHLVELRSAQGATALELCWTPGPEALLAAAASEAMSAPTTPAGVVALPDLDAALVVQQAARQAALQSVPVEDALDLFTARLVDDGTRAGPLAAVFLCGEFERTADSELLAAATRVVLEGTPAAGLGVAATRVCLARLVAGLSFRAVTERVRAVAATLDAPRLLEAAVDRQLSAAELLIVTASAASGIEQGSGPSGRPVPPSALFRLLRALGLQLGAGLPGSAVSPLPTDRLAHLTTIFGLLPEDLATSTRPHWGVSASELAERAVPMLLDRLQHEPLGAGHGWLAVLSNLQ